MKRRASPPPDAAATAAEWYVALDASPPDELGEARLTAWLDRAADHEPDLERCGAAVEIARRLRDDPDLRFAYDEAAAIAAREPSQTTFRSRRLTWPKLASAVAALAAAAAIALWLAPQAQKPSGVAAATAGTQPPAPVSLAARIVALAPGSDPAIELPGRVMVDASSVALLPFLETTDADAARAGVAAELHRDLLGALRAIPGIYVIGEASVSPYATLDLRASEIGAQLGARAVLGAHLAVAAGDVVVTARLLDAATDSPLWEARYELPLEQLGTIRVAMIDGIAAALVDPVLRARSVRGAARAKADNVVAATTVEAAFQ